MRENREGQRVPDVDLVVRENGAFSELSTRRLFAGRRVVVFALPGAFTPTCSSTHLPRYEELAPEFARAGVDEIVCLTVNDPFVVEAWGQAQGANRVRLVPDGNGAFSAAMGMLVDKQDLGFGARSWRYSMLVDDGVIEKMFIEPDEPGDPFHVSDADTMLQYLDPTADIPESVALFTKPGCPHCARARDALDARGLQYEEIVLGRDATSRSLSAITGQSTVPQAFIGGRHIGGADELESLLHNDEREQ